MQHVLSAAAARAAFPALLAVLAVSGIPAQTATTSSKLALGGLDPIELTRGREVHGSEAVTLAHGRFLYRFADDAHRATFASDPARYAIQLGGGCGAMGPLSGVGDPSRFAIHEGRIYIFASDACRRGFLADPAAHLAKPDPLPTGDAAAARRASELIARAVEAAGGAAKLDAMASLVLIRDEVAEHEGKLHKTGAAVFVRFPDAIRQESWWGDWHRTDVVVGDSGFVHERGAGETGVWDHDASQVQAVLDRVRRHPLAILRARTRPDFVAFHVGAGKVGDRAVERVITAHDGATSTLAIDAENGRIREVAYDGTAGGARRALAVGYDEFLEQAGVLVPTTSTVARDGRAGQPTTWTSVAVDQPLGDEWFDRARIAEARSAKPGINASFLGDDADVASFVQRFEGESREIWVARHRIAKAVGIAPGERVADIGAGTGLFLQLFADAVGPDGKVYAVEIAPKFVAHLREKAAQKDLAQVEVVLCTERSTELPPDSIDVAFVCDTYHHFEYPSDTLASLHAALRPGGRLVVVDFERIPGKSREFILNHVRAGREVFRAEIEAAGFEFVEAADVRGLRENYVLRFERK